MVGPGASHAPRALEVVRTAADVWTRVDGARRAGLRIGMVPTMGFLHAGHLALIARALGENDRVVVTLFVNPTQFGPGEDFERYPRDAERDEQLCRDAGVDWLYMPSVADLYPEGPGTMVLPPATLTDGLCGKFRPGHFQGVATVVAKLFALWQPARAYFGKKDFQQTAVIQALVRDLAFPVEVVLVPTVREADGLAMSSRNVYLSAEERHGALSISLALQAAWEAARRSAADAATTLAAARSILEAEGALTVQYMALVDPITLTPLADGQGGATGVLAVAAFAGRTRLIDNADLGGPAPLGVASARREEVTP